MNLISILNEKNEGFGTYKIGDTITSKLGNKITITDIVINASSTHADVSIFYEFVTVEGKKGHERNNFKTFIQMIRDD